MDIRASITKEQLNTLLLIAAENDHLDILEFLRTEGASVPNENYLSIPAWNPNAKNKKYHIAEATFLYLKFKNSSNTLDLNNHSKKVSDEGWTLLCRWIEKTKDTGSATASRDQSIITSVQLDKLNAILKQNKQKENIQKSGLLPSANEFHLPIQPPINQEKKTPEKDNNQNATLFAAAKEGRLADIQELIKNGASISEKDKEGNTLLIIAAKNDQLEVVEWLGIQGAEVSKELYLEAKDTNNELYFLAEATYLYIHYAKIKIDPFQTLKRLDLTINPKPFSDKGWDIVCRWFKKNGEAVMPYGAAAKRKVNDSQLNDYNKIFSENKKKQALTSSPHGIFSQQNNKAGENFPHSQGSTFKPK